MEPTRTPSARPRSDAAVPSLAEHEALQREKDALRIQAAGVAAQQAALTEEELRLAQRCAVLEHQERQLATHLEEKRQRLLQLREEAKQARVALQNERAEYEARVSQVTGELNQARREIAESQRQVQTERQRTLAVRQRLKQRWHRQWATERTAMRQRQKELHDLRSHLEKEAHRLSEEKSALAQAQRRFHGAEELGKRQLQAEWEKLRREQQQWTARRTQEQIALHEQAQALAHRETTLVEAEQNLAAQRQHWEESLRQGHREAEGLESRIQNGRQKLHEQEQELLRLQMVLRDLQARREALATTATAPRLQASSVDTLASLPPPVAQLYFVQADLKRRELELGAARSELHRRSQTLERLASQLADQRLQLAEQCARLLQARQCWQEERDSAARDLASREQQLQDREQALPSREQALATSEAKLRQRQAELTQARLCLEGRQARVTEQLAAWEGERARLTAALQPREQLAAQQLAAVAELRQQWQERRCQQAGWLRSKYRACEDPARAGALRAECLQRHAALEQERRAVAERALALEQYRQECLGKAANPVAAEKRLEQLRRRWTALATTADRAVARERQALQAEAERLEHGHRELEQGIAILFTQEAELSSRQTTWEEEQLRRRLDQEKLQQEVKSLHAQRESYERQLQELRDEVERLARLLLDDAEPSLAAVVQAA